MWSGRVAFENDACPVGDDLLGQLYRSNENGLPALVASVSPDIRAMLALYCYRRSHLHALGVAIAASCDERELSQWGGRAGTTLFAISRQAPMARPAPSGHRKSITLSTAPLSALPAMDDIDDEAEEPIVA
ncbi:hypothetical protein [Bradyrhizobium sp. 2TAF24]|uniref:hypothetical protein n=1 Tax=Bradyrhizobium sp. 2TAF24 TaxID=3233011 RepID=UPI003F9049E7